jgi:hypothetical protein
VAYTKNTSWASGNNVTAADMNRIEQGVADAHDHIADPSAAHAASAISVSPTGLLVVTSSNVQAAIAELDARVGAEMWDSGTLAARPAAASVPIGYEYLAEDDDGGTSYRSTGAAWLTTGAGVLETGGRELVQASGSTSLVLTTSAQDIAGASVVVTFGSRPVWLHAQVWGQIGKGTGTTGEPTSIQLDVVDTAGPTVIDSFFYKAGLPASGNVQQMIKGATRIAAQTPGSQKTYKLQAKMNTQAANSTGSIVGNAGAPYRIWAVEG